MGKGSGGGTNTVTNNSAPPAQYMAAYTNAINNAGQVASQPYTPYSGQMVAGLTPDQTASMNTVDNAQGMMQPYTQAAVQATNNSQTPIWSNVQQFSPSGIAQYMSPYTQQVVDTTQANIDESNAEAQQGIVGNAMAKGAFGGDRVGIAQAETARQQALAENQTIAGLQNQGYTQGLQEFNTQQQAQIGANEANNWLNSQAAAAYGAEGTSAQTATLQGAQAQSAQGAQQQTQNQSALNVPYEQYLAEQAYPIQMSQYYANIAEGLGGASGGTSSTTSPSPSTLSQLGGLGIAGLGAYGSFINEGGSTGIGAGLSSLFGSGAAASDAGDASVAAAEDLMFNVKRGGRVGYDEGGVVGGIGGISAGANPLTQNLYQKFAQMPVEKLQEAAARIPANNPQGQMIQRALQQKQIMPATNQQPQSGIAAPGTAQPGTTSDPNQLPSLANPPGYARGGRLHMDAGGNPDDPYGTGNYDPAQDWSNYGLANNLDAHADSDPDQLNDRMDPTRLSWGMTKDKKDIGPIDWKGFAADDKPSGISADKDGHISGRYSDFGEEYGPEMTGSTPMPNSIPSTSGRSGPPPAPGAAKRVSASPSPTGIAASRSSDETPKSASKGSDAANMALMAAGFGMMSGTSPHAMVNIGRGGLEGVKEYGNVKNAERQAQQLANEAEYHKNQLALESRKADQQGDYQRGELGNSAARIAMERDHYATQDENGKWFSGVGTDANGNTVNGMYHAANHGGEPEFHPGLTMNGINRRGPTSDFDINKQAQITTEKELTAGTITKDQYAQRLQMHIQELMRNNSQSQPPAGTQPPANRPPLSQFETGN